MNISLNSLIKKNVRFITKYFSLVNLVNEAITHVEPIPLILIVIASVSYVVPSTHATRVNYDSIKSILIARLPRLT